MKRILTLVALALSSGLLPAQSTEKDKFSVQMSAGYTPLKDIQTVGIIVKTNTGFTEVSYVPQKNIYFKKFDSKGTLLKTETSNALPNDFGDINRLATFNNGKSYWMHDKKSNHLVDASYEMIEIGTNKVSTVLDILEKDYYYKCLESTKYGEIICKSWVLSKDKTKVIIACRIQPFGKGAASKNEKICYWVLDENMQKLSEKKMDVPFDAKSTECKDYAIDNNGTPYMLVKVTETPDKKEKRGTKPAIHFDLYNLKDVSTKIPIPNEGKYIEELALKNADDGTIIVAGLYSNTNTSKGSNGVVVYKVNTATNTVSKVSKGFIEFPTSLIEKFEFAKTKSKVQKEEEKGISVGIVNLVLRDLELKKDGSLLVSGEQFWRKELSSSTGEPMGSIQHYEDVFAMRIQGDGTVAWSQKIPKFQKGSAAVGSMSFHHETFNNQDYFFYVDNIKNLDLPIDNEPHTHADGMGGFLTYIKIDEKGNMTKGHLFDLREKDINMAPTDFVRIDDNAIMCTVQSGKIQKKVLIVRLK